jgi:hypothetical protein
MACYAMRSFLQSSVKVVGVEASSSNYSFLQIAKSTRPSRGGLMENNGLASVGSTLKPIKGEAII